MKKLISLLLAAMMVLGLAACGKDDTGSSDPTPTPDVTQSADPVEDDQEETPTELTVNALDGNKEPIEVTVPYDPQRVVVLDLASLDILDNLGLGDRIVGAPTTTLDYLQSYVEDSNVANLGSVKTPDLEAVIGCDPEIIFMGGRMAEYYDDLVEIAPVVRLATDNADPGLVESVRANAKVIGSIFGKDDEVDNLLAQYDARIQALTEFAEGKTAVLGMCTSGGFNVLGNDGRCSIIVDEIGFDNIGADAAANTGSGRGGSSDDSNSEDGNSEGSGGHGGHGDSDSGSGRSGGHGGSDDSESSSNSDGSDGSDSAVTSNHGNEASFELIVALDPDYIFVMDRDAAISSNGAQLAKEIMENELVMSTDAYKNGNLVILEHPAIWYTAEGGITSLGIMLDDLENALSI